MTLLKEVEEYFSAKDLYEVLGIDKGATSDEIKKAYRKVSLKVHPDRVGESLKQEATKRFQVLSKVHYVLSDDERRKLYDDHGVIDSEGNLESDTDWMDYWRVLFPKVTAKDVDKFFEKYIGSEEEEVDLISVYNKYQGDLDKVVEAHIGYDEERTVNDLNRLLKEGKIKPFDKFVNESAAKKAKRLKRFQREAKEAAKAKKESASSMDDLSALIQRKNNKSFDDMISNLEAKYSKPKGTKRKLGNR